LRLLPERPLGYILDVDSTVVERFGEREGALQGYNPRKRGGMTHNPVLAGLAESRVLLHAWLRSGNATSFVALAARRAGEWVDLGDGLAVAEARIKLGRWTRERGLVLVRHSVAERDPPKGKRLPGVEGYRFQAIVTSFPPEGKDAAAICRAYLPRGEFENRIKELKQGCGLNGFRLEDFLATETVLRALCPASPGTALTHGLQLQACQGGPAQPALNFDG